MGKADANHAFLINQKVEMLKSAVSIFWVLCPNKNGDSYNINLNEIMCTSPAPKLLQRLIYLHETNSFTKLENFTKDYKSTIAICTAV